MVDEFLPDDICPLGAQFMDTSKAYLETSKTCKLQGPLLTIDDDVLADPVENKTKQNAAAMELPDLLSVNQLLESVCHIYSTLFISSLCLSE